MVSCKSRKPQEPVRIETTKTITQTIKDTVYKVEADSAYYYAWIDCQNGKPVLMNTAQEAENYNRKYPGTEAEPAKSQPGKNTKVNAILQNGKLNVSCKQESMNLFKSWKENYIKENQKTSVPVYLEKPFRWYHMGLMGMGGISVLMLIIGTIIKFNKPFKI